MPPTPDELVRVYIKIRDTIRAKEAAHKEQIATMKEDFERVGAELLEHCKDNNVTSVTTEFGTFFRTEVLDQ